MKGTTVRFTALLECVALGLLALLLESVAAAAQSPVHGMWVYGVVPRSPAVMCPSSTGLLDEDPGADELLRFCAANSITELYLSLGSGARALSDSRLPNFIRSLKGRLRVEALIGCSRVADCQARTWRTRIDEVMAYNDRRADAMERFDGIHLDLEPWIGTCPAPPEPCDFSWVPDLVSYYQDASSALQGSGLTLAADMSGVKAISDGIGAADRQALLDAATRLVLMEYEEPSVERINEHVDAFRNAVDLSVATFTIATRVQDFGFGNACQNGTVLRQFDERYATAQGYAGWVTFKYSDANDCRHYGDVSICPGDCCIIRP